MAEEQQMSPEDDATKKDARKQLLDAAGADMPMAPEAAAEGAEMADEGAAEEQAGEVA